MLHRIKPFFYRKFKTSFSKSGEDVQLWQLLKKGKGSYIDVGGHHPIFGNNSYYFYIRGWKGIVVEPNPDFKPLYQKFRPDDVLFSGGVAGFDGELDYFELSASVRNTFSKDHLKEFSLEDKVTSSKKLPVKKLSSIISELLINFATIDFLSVDVEGKELEVIKSNDWEKYRPSYILLESHVALESDMESELVYFFKDIEYKLIGKSLQGFHLGTLWFRSNETEFYSFK